MAKSRRTSKPAARAKKKPPKGRPWKETFQFDLTEEQARKWGKLRGPRAFWLRAKVVDGKLHVTNVAKRHEEWVPSNSAFAE
jgi:hypothetical protein